MTEPREFRYGFRIVGPPTEPRRLVDAGAAFAGYCQCDPRAKVESEAYLSAFHFGAEFRRHLESTGSTRGYAGPCWTPWLWFDLDSDGDLARGQAAAVRLVEAILSRYGLSPGEVLAFFSGSKGFHVGLPTALWRPEPSESFHRTAKHFAENVAAIATVAIDAGVYDRVRAFRAPNSRHPKTGLFKRRLTLDELKGPLDAILEAAKEPFPFDPPTVAKTSDEAVAGWKAAIDQTRAEAEAKAARRIEGARLNRATLDFIRNGAVKGDRHRMLFSAAANLAEFGCPPDLAHALLAEAGLDSGLPPSEVRRQIECGLRHGERPPAEAAVSDAPDRSAGVESAITDALQNDLLAGRLRALWKRSADVNPAASADRHDTVSGKSDTAHCKRCDSKEIVAVPLGDGRYRIDCARCGRFIDWKNWPEPRI